MSTNVKPRRSIWTWGLESEEPTDAERTRHAAEMSERFGVEIVAPPIPRVQDLELRRPRIGVPAGFDEFCFTDNYERALHSYSADDRHPAVLGHFPNPPDVVAHPRTESELERVLGWCDSNGYVAIPFGGGSSVVGGVTPPEVAAVVTVDMDRFDAVLEIDKVSRAARIQAGVFGPDLESQLRPHGLTLRHYPQSFTGSTLGGWIATRSGGHYATNHTHIDEFVESVRMLTPCGWWESRRLPGSGAGPDPNRLAIGSEGILGIITEAWMRIQVRPKYRATAGVTFPTWEGSYEAARHIVQAKLWPSNLRVLDPELSRDAAGMDGDQALLIIGFESAELPQDWNIRAAVDMARQSGGQIDDDEILIDDGSGTPTGRSGAVGSVEKCVHKRQRGADGRTGPCDGDVRDGGDVGPLARAGRSRTGCGRSRPGGRVRRRLAQLPFHSRLSRRPRALLLIRGGVPERRLRRTAGRDQEGGFGRDHRGGRNDHAPSRGRQTSPALVRSGAAGGLCGGAASGEEVSRSERDIEPGGLDRPVALHHF